MPSWDTAELPGAPVFTRRNWFALLGPGLVMGAAAVAGGEWLLGPKVTAQYGGALLWVATLSILFQCIYNIEVSRYALYCGEPIFTGKFRTAPGPRFWLIVYLCLDFGVLFPYLAANAATPIATLIKGGALPDPAHDAGDWWMMKALAYGVFLLALVPLLFGGKVYSSLKAVMTFKLIVVFGFLLILAVFYSSFATWTEIGSGFLEFGTVPIELPEGAPRVRGNNVDNIFVALFEGRGLPDVDFSMIAFIAALAAIAGAGGLTNTVVSNYTRDLGWAMGSHVGAIPSMVGGKEIKLSHVGCVFEVNDESWPRWRRWYRHVVRDQVAVWMPACFVGLALPCMLSVQFLPHGTESDNWTTAAMTASGVHDHVTEVSGAAMGDSFWFMTLFCGFLVLGLGMVFHTDALIRRWVDVFWTSTARLRGMEPKHIKKVYYRVLAGYSLFGLIMLSIEPGDLIKYATMFFNIALGFSCWHALVINLTLLPRRLRPNLFVRVGLIVAGVYFFTLGVITILATTRVLGG